MDVVKRERYALALAYADWTSQKLDGVHGYWEFYDKGREAYLRMAEDFEKLVDAATVGGIKL